MIERLSETERQWLYALACVLIPIMWGLAVVWASNRLDRILLRKTESRPGAQGDLPPLEYHI